MIFDLAKNIVTALFATLMLGRMLIAALSGKRGKR